MTSARRSAPTLLFAIMRRLAVLAPAGRSGRERRRSRSRGRSARRSSRRCTTRWSRSASGECPAPSRCTWARPPRLPPRAWPSPRPTTCSDEGRLTARQGPGNYGTCWAFANIAALESKLLPGRVARLSEDNLVGRSGYGPSLAWRYNFGGYDFMAVAYFARWAGPVEEADDPYGTQTPPTVNAVQKHVQDVVMIPGRKTWSDNALIKRLVRENGALSVGHVLGRQRLQRVHGRDRRDPGDVLPGARMGREPRRGHRRLGRPVPGAQIRGRVRPARPAPARSSCATAGAPDWGDGGYFWVSYYDRSFARDQGLGGYGGCDLLRHRRGHRQLRRASTSTTSSA